MAERGAAGRNQRGEEMPDLETLLKIFTGAETELDNCLAFRLDSFAHYVDADAGVASVAFDSARNRFDDGRSRLQCRSCGFCLRPRRQVRENRPLEIHLYPVGAYEMEVISEGECPHGQIESLKQRLGKVGLLNITTPDSI